MSKNVVIREGNTPKNFGGVKKIRINNGNGYSYWVPEDETKLGTKYINKNGTYKASRDDLYGYSEVTVSGIGSVTGIDPETGNEMTVEKDENTDELTKKIAPSKIVLERAPFRTIYADGDDIDIAGAIVRAYTKKGEDWEDEQHPNGVIPYSELTLVPDKANASQADEGTYEDGTVKIKMFTISDVYDHEAHPPAHYPYCDGQPYSEELTHAEGGYVIVPELRKDKAYYVTNYNNEYYFKPVESQIWTEGGGISWIEPNGYGASTSRFDIFSGWKKSETSGNASNRTMVSTSNAFLALDSETIGRGLHKGQKVTVKWERVGDSKELTTTFDIQVVEAPDPEEEDEE